MDVSEYKKKYLLGGASIKVFAEDFDNDFLILMRSAKGLKTRTAFRNCLICMNRKWNRIYSEIRRFHGFWKIFLERRVIPFFKQLFPETNPKWLEEMVQIEEMKENPKKEPERRESSYQRKRQGNRKKTQQKQKNEYKKQEFRTYVFRPENDYQILGLKGWESVEIVKQRYRQLVLIHHPDKGGSHETFIKITNAKNRILKIKSK